MAKSGDLQKELNIVLGKISQLENLDKCNRILHNVYPKVIECMGRVDPLFKKLFRESVYTGSYYEKLRIKDACEFDINLILEIKAEFIKVDPSPQPPSYALLQLIKPVDEMNLDEFQKRKLSSLLGSDSYILPAKVLSWMQAIIDKSVLTNITVSGVNKISYSSSGPAKTLLILLDDNKTEISVDLVPVFRFQFKDWPKQLKSLKQATFSKVHDNKKQLYLVPKQYKSGMKQSPHEPTAINKPRIWRMHFADTEKSILDDRHLAKPVIKLLKLLRDSQGWKGLHSYFLKSLVLRDVIENPKKQWGPSCLAENLLGMLEKLKSCLDQKKLEHLFFTSVNLFQFMNDAEMAGISNRVAVIMKHLRSDPKYVSLYFKF